MLNSIYEFLYTNRIPNCLNFLLLNSISFLLACVLYLRKTFPANCPKVVARVRDVQTKPGFSCFKIPI